MAVNIILLVLIVALANIDKIITFFGGDFANTTKIYIKDNSNSYETFKNNFEALTSYVGDYGNFEISLKTESTDKLKENLKEDKAIIVEINESNEEYLNTSVYSYDPVDTITIQLITGAVNAVKTEYALVHSEIDPKIFGEITSPANISFITTNPDLEENAEANDIMIGVITVIFIIPFFLLVIMLVQMLGAEINDEKTTRSMEIIISNVSPKVHFFSKIIAATGFVLLQAVLFFVYGGLGLLTRTLTSGGMSGGGETLSKGLSSVMDMLKNSGILASLGNSVILIILVLILNLFAFALLAGVLASMTTSTEDFQQLQAPLMILCVAGYYLAFMAVYFKGAAFIKVLSFFPFLSAMIAPVIYLLGQTTLIHLGISVIIVFATCFLLFHFGLRVYKVGILNYSSKDLWKKVFKSIKEKN